MALKEKVTVERDVDPRIADLIHFVRYVGARANIDMIRDMEDKDLVNMARDFWDRQHGDD